MLNLKHMTDNRHITYFNKIQIHQSNLVSYINELISTPGFVNSERNLKSLVNARTKVLDACALVMSAISTIS